MIASRSTRTTRQRAPAAATTAAPFSLDGDATAIAAAAVVAPVPHAPSAPTTAPSTDASSSSSDGMQCDPEEGPRLSAKEKGKGRDPAANDEPVAAAAPVTAGGSSNPRPTPRPPRRATKCNACYKPITEGQKQYEAKHLACYHARKIVSDCKFDVAVSRQIGDNPEDVLLFCKELVASICRESSFKVPEEAPPVPAAAPNPQPVHASQGSLRFADSRILENVDFFQNVFSTAQVWQHFVGDLRHDAELQRKLVVRLLQEIGQVFAEYTKYMPDVQLYSTSAHLVGLLRWLAKGTSDLCNQLHGEELLDAAELFWKEASIKKIMLDMTRHSLWQVEEGDLGLWEEPVVKRTSLTPEAFMEAADRLEALIFGSATPYSDNAVKIYGILATVNARTRAYDERPLSHSTLKVRRTVKREKAGAENAAGAGDNAEGGAAGQTLAEGEMDSKKKGKEGKDTKKPEKPVSKLCDFPKPGPSAPFNPEVAARAAEAAKAEAAAAAESKAPKKAAAPSRKRKAASSAGSANAKKKRGEGQGNAKATASTSSKKRARPASSTDRDEEDPEWEDQVEQEDDAQPVKKKGTAKLSQPGPAPPRAARATRAAASKKSYAEPVDEDAPNGSTPKKQRLEPAVHPLQNLSPNKASSPRRGALSPFLSGSSVRANLAPKAAGTAAPGTSSAPTASTPRVAPGVPTVPAETSAGPHPAPPTPAQLPLAAMTSSMNLTASACRADAPSLAAPAPASTPAPAASAAPAAPAAASAAAAAAPTPAPAASAAPASAAAAATRVQSAPATVTPSTAASVAATDGAKGGRPLRARVAAGGTGSAGTTGRTPRQSDSTAATSAGVPAPAKTVPVEGSGEDAQAPDEMQVVHKIYLSKKSKKLRDAVTGTPNMVLTEDVRAADFHALDTTTAPANCIQSIISGINVISEECLADWIAHKRDKPRDERISTPAYKTKCGCGLRDAALNHAENPSFLAGRSFALDDAVIGTGEEKKRLADSIRSYIVAAGGTLAKSSSSKVETVYRDIPPTKGASIHLDALMKMLWAQKA